MKMRTKEEIMKNVDGERSLSLQQVRVEGSKLEVLIDIRDLLDSIRFESEEKNRLEKLKVSS